MIGGAPGVRKPGYAEDSKWDLLGHFPGGRARQLENGYKITLIKKKKLDRIHFSLKETELIMYVNFCPELMGTYMFGMSYCKTDECKELISGYSIALMV